MPTWVSNGANSQFYFQLGNAFVVVRPILAPPAKQMTAAATRDVQLTHLAHAEEPMCKSNAD
jgi:hypothetical protein